MDTYYSRCGLHPLMYIKFRSILKINKKYYNYIEVKKNNTKFNPFSLQKLDFLDNE